MNEALQEYKRLCRLIGGTPPYGECELVALMIHRVMPESEIIEGIVTVEIDFIEEKIKHFWVMLNEEHIDPLSEDWQSTVISRSIFRTVSAAKILEDYRASIQRCPDPSYHLFSPLRWKLKDELL